MSMRTTSLLVFSQEEAQTLRDVIASPLLTQEHFVKATDGLVVDEIKVFTTREIAND